MTPNEPEPTIKEIDINRISIAKMEAEKNKACENATDMLVQLVSSFAGSDGESYQKEIANLLAARSERESRQRLRKLGRGALSALLYAAQVGVSNSHALILGSKIGRAAKNN